VSLFSQNRINSILGSIIIIYHIPTKDMITINRGQGKALRIEVVKGKKYITKRDMM